MPAITALFGFALRYRRLFFVNIPSAYPWIASPFFDWRLDAATLPLLATAVSATPLTILFNGPGIWSSEFPDVEFPASQPISPHLVTNRGIFSYSSQQAHMDFFSSLAGGAAPACLSQSLLRPTAALLAQREVTVGLAAMAKARAEGKRVLGMHVRVGDGVMLYERITAVAAAAAAAAAASAAASADGLAPAAPTPAASPSAIFPTIVSAVDAALAAVAPQLAASDAQLFFVSDSAGAKALVRERLPGAITTDTLPEHVGNDADDPLISKMLAPDGIEAMRSTLADWWLLSQADAQLGPLTSGFSRSAVVASRTGAWASGKSCEPCCGAKALDCHGEMGPAYAKAQMSGSRRRDL